MPAPSPYTPPHPAEPPNHQTPRLSLARRLSTPTPGSRAARCSQTPVSIRNRCSSVCTASKQIIFPSTSTGRSQTPEPSRTSNGQGDPSLDEDLRDPEFFIKLFSQSDGQLLHSDVELREKLERYLLKVNLCQDSLSMPGTSKDKRTGASHVNFAEAALVVQGSTRIYGKKVDLLFNAAIQLFRLLSTPFEEQEEEGEDEVRTHETPKSTKGNKRLRLGLENRDLAEDILLVDGMKEGGKIEQKKSSRPRFSELVKNLSTMPPRGGVRFLPPNIPRLVRKTKTLGTNDKEVEKINVRRVPQYGQGMESRGFIDEYRLNEVIRKSDNMLVEHFVPLEPECNRSSIGEGNPQSSKGCGLHPSQCDSGIDSCPSSVYNPVDSSDSIIWDGSSVGLCGETDALSCADDGFVSEGIQEEGISELEEESELDINKGNARDALEGEVGGQEVVEMECGISEPERSATESSGNFSEIGPADESQPATLIEDEREAEMQEEAHEAREPEMTASKDSDPVISTKSSTSVLSGLKEVEVTPTPRRNKRKMKNFKLPCKLSLLLPEKKKRVTRESRASELWRPSQSPCSSTSSHYPQSPASFAPASPDPHSLSQLMLQDDDHHEDLDNLSESDNEGEYFDPPADGQPQINYWIQNHQKDLMSAGQPVTLSDQVAQWQELIMPRLEANLRFGPYSHVRYAPVLMELMARDGWPPPENPFLHGDTTSDDEYGQDIDDSGDEFELDRINTSNQVACPSSLDANLCPVQIQYDKDFMDPKEDEVRIIGDNFFGFQTSKRMKRRGVGLVESSLKKQPSEGHLFTFLSKLLSWGLRQEEVETQQSEKMVNRWVTEKTTWLQSKVKSNRVQRNWDEWEEENDNIETSSDLNVYMPSASVRSAESSEPVSFPTVFSGFRKEEVSRLLFTALHLASQGVMEITSEPGEINSMKLSIVMDNRR